MRYYIGEGHPDAPADRPWAVCDENGPTGEFYATRAGALARLTELSATELAAMDTEAGDEFEIAWESDPAIAFQDTVTSDRRIFHEFGFRDVPLPFLTQFTTAWGHDGAHITGRIDEIAVSGTNVTARGVFDARADRGREAADLCGSGTLTGVSVDPGNPERYEFEVLEIDDEGWPVDWLEHYYGCQIMGATQVAFPAFADAAIRLVAAASEDEPAEGESDENAAAGGAASGRAPAPTARAAASTREPELVASAAKVAQLVASGEYHRPRDWFEDPNLAQLTPLTITDDGRLFGHIATWEQVLVPGDECHIGFPNTCQRAPRSASGYAYFRTGSVLCDDGSVVATGPIVMHASHASTDPRVSWQDAVDHYANTALAVADVALYDDSIGIAAAGAIRPGTRPEDVYALRASELSPDWRQIGGTLEAVAVMAVNTSGFPQARPDPEDRARVVVASGRPVAMVGFHTGRAQASQNGHGCGCGGAGGGEALASLVGRLERLERDLGPTRRDALLARIRTD